MDPTKMGTADYWIWLWESYGKDMVFSTVAAAINIAAVIAAYLIGRFLIFQLLNRVLIGSLTRVRGNMLRARQATVAALQSVLKSAIGFVLAFVAVMMILQFSGVRVETLLATAGVAGIAIGIGAQKLVRDMIAGFFVLAEDQYGIGDYVTIDTASGIVEDVTLRATRIRDDSGRLHVIANGDPGAICNYSRGKLKVDIDLVLPASTDIEKATRLLNDIGRRAAADKSAQLKSPFECEGLVKVTGTTVTLRFSGAVVPLYREEVIMDINSRVLDAFKENDLQLV